MQFKKYPKLYHLHKEETEWILNSGYVYVQEKLDWANASCFLSDDGEKIITCSRNNVVEWFRWLTDYIRSHEGIRYLLWDRPHLRLYWEWLVKHTVDYGKENMNKFYVFDIVDERTDEWLSPLEVVSTCVAYNIDYAKIHWQWDVKELTGEMIEEFAHKSFLWVQWEWVVIKPLEFTNKFGDRVYAKYVTSAFKEKNHITFGNHFKWEIEMYITWEWCTLWRVRKIISKCEDMKERKLALWDTPMVLSMVYYDILKEDGYEILTHKKIKWKVLDIAKLKRFINHKTREIFHTIVNWEELSVAFT